jgi:hypothetical protein
MDTYAQREKKARLELIQECSNLELELFRNELGGIGVGVGTQIKDRGNGSLGLSYNEDVTKKISDLALQIGDKYTLKPNISGPDLERQVGAYVLWCYFVEQQ